MKYGTFNIDGQLLADGGFNEAVIQSNYENNYNLRAICASISGFPAQFAEDSIAASTINYNRPTPSVVEVYLDINSNSAGSLGTTPVTILDTRDLLSSALAEDYYVEPLDISLYWYVDSFGMGYGPSSWPVITLDNGVEGTDPTVAFKLNDIGYSPLFQNSSTIDGNSYWRTKFYRSDTIYDSIPGTPTDFNVYKLTTSDGGDRISLVGESWIKVRMIYMVHPKTFIW